MGLHLAAARDRLGALLGGDEGASLRAEAARHPADEGFVDADRMFEIVAPGLARPGPDRPAPWGPRPSRCVIDAPGARSAAQGLRGPAPPAARERGLHQGQSRRIEGRHHEVDGRVSPPAVPSPRRGGAARGDLAWAATERRIHGHLPEMPVRIATVGGDVLVACESRKVEPEVDDNVIRIRNIELT